MKGLIVGGEVDARLKKKKTVQNENFKTYRVLTQRQYNNVCLVVVTVVNSFFYVFIYEYYYYFFKFQHIFVFLIFHGQKV